MTIEKECINVFVVHKMLMLILPEQTVNRSSGPIRICNVESILVVAVSKWLYISSRGCEFLGKGYQRKPKQWAPTNSIDSTLNEYFKKRMMHVSCNWHGRHTCIWTRMCVAWLRAHCRSRAPMVVVWIPVAVTRSSTYLNPSPTRSTAFRMTKPWRPARQMHMFFRVWKYVCHNYSFQNISWFPV